MTDVNVGATSRVKTGAAPAVEEKTAEEVKLKETSIFTKIKEKATGGYNYAAGKVKIGYDKAATFTKNAGATMEYTVDNMSEGMKYSAISAGAGFGLSAISRLVSSFLKNKTALSIVKNTGWVGFAFGVGSLISFAVAALKKNNDNVKENKEQKTEVENKKTTIKNLLSTLKEIKEEASSNWAKGSAIEEKIKNVDFSPLTEK